MTLTADEVLAKAYGTSTNRVTPTVVSTLLIAPGVAVELSSNAQPDLGDAGRVLYGVSVALLQPDGTARKVLGGLRVTTPLKSGVFGSRAAAEQHIEAMRMHLLLTAPSPKGDN